MGLKKFHMSDTYRGVQIHLCFFANSVREAAEMTGFSEWQIKHYASIIPDKIKAWEGVMAYMNSDWIIAEKGRKDLWEKKMPIEELKKIINKYVNQKYKGFRKHLKSPV